MKCEVRTFVTGMSRAFALVGEKVVLVDAGAKGDEASLARGMERIGVQPDQVSLIVLTHAHQDHTAPLPALRHLTGAPLMCHRHAAMALADSRDEDVIPRTAIAGILHRLIGRHSAKRRHPMDVDIVVDEERDLSPYGVDARIIPTPGHTPGSVSLVTGSGAAIIGDLVMKLGPGKPQLALFSNNEIQLHDSLQDLLNRHVQTFHLAHGGSFPREVVEKLVSS